MKNLFVLALTLCVFVSCTSTTGNQVKIKAAEAIQKGVESALTKVYAEVDIENYSCSDEVKLIGKNVYNEVAKALRVQEISNSAVNLSVLKPICELVLNSVLPKLINSGADYRCLKYVGSEGMKKVSSKVCGYL